MYSHLVVITVNMLEVLALPIRKMYILFWIGCEEDRGILKPTAT